MRALLFLGGGLLIGVGLTHAEAQIHAEKKAQEKLREELASHKRVLEMAAEKFLADQTEAPFQTEAELDQADTSEDAIKVGGEMVQETNLSDLTPSVDYLNHAKEYAASPMAAPVSPVSYITEEEFHEEDGRDKQQILIHMGEDEPLFISEGIILPDWKELISPNILVDMYQRLTPDVANRVLYVRNDRNDTDYEVIQEIP